MDIQRIKLRRDFLKVARAKYSAGTYGLVMQALKTPKSSNQYNSNNIRIGFTASKKVGNAVCRNRAKRRLRELAREVMPIHAMSGYDYVIIARITTNDRSFDNLRRDFKKALNRLDLCHDTQAK